MIMPGFTADAALCRTRAPYFAKGVLDQAPGMVRAQFGCDQTCVDDCEAGCPSEFDCSDLPLGSQRAACLREVQICPDRCRRDCGCDRASRALR